MGLRKLRAGFIAATAAAACASAAQAQVSAVWLGGAANWNNGTMWSNGAPPNNGGGTTYNVFIDDGNAATSDVLLNMNATISNLTVDAGDMLRVQNDRTLMVAGGGFVDNAGVIRLDSTGGNTYFRPAAGPVTLTGGGRLVFSDNPNNWMYQSNGGSLVNLDNTIEGAGHLGWSGASTAITNDGTVLANATNPLLVHTGGFVFTNTGILRAANGATLELNGNSYVNTGGVVEALDGSLVNLRTVFRGGTFQTAGSGAVHGATGTQLDGATSVIQNDGLFRVPGGNTTLAFGEIVNTDTIEIDATTVNDDAYFRPHAGELRLTGGGVVQMTDSLKNWIFQSSGGSLVNVDNTIQGAGNVGWSGASTPINNQGAIIANLPSGMRCDSGGFDVTNTGVLRADGGQMELRGRAYDNAGGAIEALNGSILSLRSTIRGGTLQTANGGVIHGATGTRLEGTTHAVSNTGHLRIPGGNTTLAVGTIENTGTIEINALLNNNDAYLRPVSGELRLTGGGVVQMSDSLRNWIYQSSGGSLVNVDNTIQGAGNVGWNGASTVITNQATIVANLPSGMICDSGSALFTNTGVLRADGGHMEVRNNVTQNAGGLIEARNGSIVSLRTVLRGGTLATNGNGLIHGATGTTLDGVANTIDNTGHFRIPGGNTTLAVGTIRNTGTIEIDATTNNNNAYLRPSGDVLTLTGGGEVVMTESALNWIYQGNGGSFVNEDNTIRGAGNLGWTGASTPITNRGAIIADSDTVGLTCTSGSLLFDNQGELMAVGDAGISIPGSNFTTSGSVTIAANSSISRGGSYVQTAGGTLVEGTLSATQGVNLHGGDLAGDGTVAANLSNGGVVLPGTSVGTLSVTGTYTQTAGGRLAAEIGGLNPGEVDLLAVTEQATLDGRFEATAVGGYQPAIGDRAVVLTCGSRTGRFSQVTATNFPNNLTVTVEHFADRSELVVVRRGDMNCDGVLDAFDIEAFITALLDPNGYASQYPNCERLNADINQDGAVDAFDIEPFVTLLVGP